jgi:cytochrome c553
MRTVLRRIVVATVLVAALVDALRTMIAGGPPSTPRPAPERHSAMFRQFVLTALALLVAGGILAGVVLVSGVVPIKASSGHWQVTEWFLQFAKRRSVATQSILIDVPSLDDPALVAKGATHFDIACRPCHGSPDLRWPVVAQQMTPRPPDLASSVGRYDAAALFYIVRHGIKFTGMPAWPSQARSDEVWAMVAFLQSLPTLDAGEYERLARPSLPDPPYAPIQAIAAEVPRALVEHCGRCHGADGLGRGTGAFPKIAGQRAAYLGASLQAYARGQRHSGIMQPIAAALSAQELRLVTDYYARLAVFSRPAILDRPADRLVADRLVEEGRALATRGIPDRLVPPCAKCHGPNRQDTNPRYPRLAGQYADYLELQLTLFRNGSRGGTDYQHIMSRAARQLTPAQARAAAAFYASLAPAGDGSQR